MSAPFNRRFALEQAVSMYHEKNTIDRPAKVIEVATKFYDWLEEVK